MHPNKQINQITRSLKFNLNIPLFSAQFSKYMQDHIKSRINKLQVSIVSGTGLMAWCWSGSKPLPETMLHTCDTRGRWVDVLGITWWQKSVCFRILIITDAGAQVSLQNKIWNLLDRSTILPKFIYGKEGKLAGPTQVLPVRVRGPALLLKTDW